MSLSNPRGSAPSNRNFHRTSATNADGGQRSDRSLQVLRRSIGLYATRASVVTLLALSVLFAWVAPSLSWNALGCKWDPGLFPTIGYQFNSVTSTNQTAFNTARGWWDADTTPDTDLVSASGDVQIEIYDKSDASVSYSAVWTYGCSGDRRAKVPVGRDTGHGDRDA